MSCPKCGGTEWQGDPCTCSPTDPAKAYLESLTQPLLERAKGQMREVIAERCAMQEHYIARYLKATGLDVTEVELCEHQEHDRNGNLSFTWWLQRCEK